MLCRIHKGSLPTSIITDFVLPPLKIILMSHVVATLEGQAYDFLASLLVTVPQRLIKLILHFY